VTIYPLTPLWSAILQEAQDSEFQVELPFITLENNQLYGVITVEPRQHNDILHSLGDGKFHPSNSSFDRGFNVLFIPSAHFKYADKENKYEYELGYTLDKFPDNSNDERLEETLSSVITLKHNHQTIGFFKFTIHHSQFGYNYHPINFELDQIFIAKNFRNRWHWLDLICALLAVINAFLEGFIRCCEVYDRVHLYLSAAIMSKGGDKIANLLLREINDTVEYLKDIYPKKADCITYIIPQID
jgi:hypothetical protein